MATITRLAPLTRSIAPPIPGTILPGIIQLARCPWPVDLQAAQDGHIDMAAADQSEGHRAVEGAGTRQGADRSAARIGQKRMSQPLFRYRSGADQSVFRLEEHLELRRNIVGDQRRNADPQVYKVAGMELLLRHAGR